MYQKLTDGFVSVEKQREIEKRAEKKEQAMSYIMCPQCDNEELERCLCNKGYNNYYCKRCRFQHINHHHRTSIADGEKVENNIDRGTLTKVIKK